MNSIQRMQPAKWVFVAFIYLMMFRLSALAEVPALKIGDKIPAAQLDELRKITSAEFSGPAFSGKLYILDFWSTGCTSCMEAFPKMEALQYQFNKRVKIIAVNPWQDNEKISEAFGKYKFMQQYRLTMLPAINGETVWKQLFPTRTVPHHVWLDSVGKVLYISAGYNTIPQHIQSVLDNKPTRMLLKPSQDYFDLKQFPLAHYLHDSFTYHDTCMLARPFYEGEGGNIYGYQEINVIDSVKQTIRFSFVNQTFLNIYKAVCNASANSGEFTPDNRVIWQVSSPAYYLEPANYAYYDQWALRNRFCIEFVIPLMESGRVFSILMDGLNRYFSKELGIKAGVQNVPRNCLLLQAPGKDKIKTAGQGEKKMTYNENDRSYHFSQYPFSEIYQLYFAHVGAGYYTGIPPSDRPDILLNETGIGGNVNLQFSEILYEKGEDLQIVMNKALNDSGLHVEKAICKVAMLVISDEVLRN